MSTRHVTTGHGIAGAQDDTIYHSLSQYRAWHSRRVAAYASPVLCMIPHTRSSILCLGTAHRIAAYAM
eukprot:1602117-Rhodomonas_salina.5